MTRTEALIKAFGWQGGTIHQVAEVTGVDVHTLLYAPKPQHREIGTDYSHGWFAGRTCSVVFNKDVNFPNYKGNSAFWLGVAEGIIAG